MIVVVIKTDDDDVPINVSTPPPFLPYNRNLILTPFATFTEAKIFKSHIPGGINKGPFKLIV